MFMVAFKGFWDYYKKKRNMEDFKSLLTSIKKITNIITSKREYMLKEIYFANTPLNAKEVQKLVKNSSNIDISLPTLYTSLQIFEEYHVLDSIYIASKKTKYYFVKGVRSQNFLICTNCGKITSFDDNPMNEQIKKVSQNKNYILFNQKALLYGTCKECNK